ncbi:MAG: HAD-IC family P-type ATPase [Clostridia bacterium]
MGDPTEGGIIVMGQKAGITKKTLEQEGYTKIGEIPFDSSAKYMAAAYEYPNGSKSILLKGAPDVLMNKSGLSKRSLEKCRLANDEFARNGMRVLAFAKSADYEGDGSGESMKAHLEKGIKLLGLAGIIDPPRADVKDAIKVTLDAGIRVIMITGDHPETALNIAKSIGMHIKGDVISGVEMDEMSDDELAEAIKSTSVFARVSPENKLQIVRALKIGNEITAMTGDGVNDAPALNGADIGIAMGIRGTEVAKDASDMILLDDRFSTIVDAIKEGRIIFDNIEKFVYFLFSCNVVEIFAIFLAISLSLPMPVLPLHILWLNLVVDILPAMSLAWEPGDKHIMKRAPRDPEKAIVTKSFLANVLLSGALIGLGALGIFVFAMQMDFGVDTARTMAFSTMAFGQLLHIFNARNIRGFGFDKTVLKNLYLPGAVAISILLQLLVVYLPFFNKVMETVPLDGIKWLWVIAFSAIPTALIQLKRKLIPSKV